MSKHSFWSGFGIATSAIIAAVSTVVGALSCWLGILISPSGIGNGDSIYAIPFEMFAALLGAVLKLVAVGCGAITLAFTIIAIVTYREHRKTERTLHLAEMERNEDPQRVGY